MEQEHHDGGTGTGRDEPTSTQGAEATGIHTITIAMIFYSPYHNYDFLFTLPQLYRVFVH